jgi:GDP/UDP-N,N'-diacetylbacillosamine 2-epimerase (hydrolysing)
MSMNDKGTAPQTNMENLRRICFLTGARSEYDLLTPVIRAVCATPGLHAEVIAGAAHLSPFHGMGIEHIRRDGFPIVGTVESLLSSESWQGRALSFSNLFEGLTRLIAANRPDILFVAGDREEALAGALAGNFLGIPVAHLHGGDRCITSELDEVLRPAISKLAHLHFTATESHRQRLIRMGEDPRRVWATGASGLDRIREEPDLSDEELSREFQVDVRKPFFLLIHHPSTLLHAEDEGTEMPRILEGVLSLGNPVFCSYPNFDPGNIAIRWAIDEAKTRNDRLIVFHTLQRDRFVSLYRRCSAIVGNSSSIVIESSFLKVPGVLVGPRQDLREVSGNVLRAEPTSADVRAACLKCLEDEAFRKQVQEAPSIYGDGFASKRIANVLAEVELTLELLRKTMTY